MLQVLALDLCLNYLDKIIANPGFYILAASVSSDDCKVIQDVLNSEGDTWKIRNVAGSTVISHEGEYYKEVGADELVISYFVDNQVKLPVFVEVSPMRDEFISIEDFIIDYYDASAKVEPLDYGIQISFFI